MSLSKLSLSERSLCKLSLSEALNLDEPVAFPSCGVNPLGIYPLVDRAEAIQSIVEAGLTTVQLRIKDLKGDALEAEIAKACHLSHEYGLRLFVNDYWEAAIRHHAYGVHLGQEDISQQALEALFSAHLRLGISTHIPDEIDRILPCAPSYVALGPVLATQSKALAYEPVGLKRFRQWVQSIPYPVVAIGGIQKTHISDVVKAGANGIAMIGGQHLDGLSLRESLALLQRLFDNTVEPKNTDVEQTGSEPRDAS